MNIARVDSHVYTSVYAMKSQFRMICSWNLFVSCSHLQNSELEQFWHNEQSKTTKQVKFDSHCMPYSSTQLCLWTCLAVQYTPKFACHHYFVYSVQVKDSHRIANCYCLVPFSFPFQT